MSGLLNIINFSSL